jgi:hypothetical protein
VETVEMAPGVLEIREVDAQQVEKMVEFDSIVSSRGATIQ